MEEQTSGGTQEVDETLEAPVSTVPNVYVVLTIVASNIAFETYDAVEPCAGTTS